MFQLKLSHEKGPEMISISEASEFLGISSESARKMAKAGFFGLTVKIGSGANRKHFRIQKEGLRKYCEVNGIRWQEHWFSEKNLI